MNLPTFLQHLISALQWGSFYALIAVGYSMVYGVLLLINFAHGDIFMVGAYIAMFIGLFLVASYDFALPFDVPAWALMPLTILLAMALTALFGVALERVAYRPLRRKGAPRLYLVITALMAGIFLEYGNVAALGTTERQFPRLFQPVSYNVGGVVFTNTRVAVIGLSIAAMLVLGYVVQRTTTGMAMRAISYDRLAVPLMGVSVDRVVVITFIIGSGMAGLAGTMFGAAYPILSFNMGLLFGWKAFIAAVVGGIGSIRGAVVGGYILGFVEIFVAAVMPSTYRDLIAFSVLLLIMAIRPTGMFGVARRTKV